MAVTVTGWQLTSNNTEYSSHIKFFQAQQCMFRISSTVVILSLLTPAKSISTDQRGSYGILRVEYLLQSAWKSRAYHYQINIPRPALPL